jgi:hypothetical protein
VPDSDRTGGLAAALGPNDLGHGPKLGVEPEIDEALAQPRDDRLFDSVELEVDADREAVTEVEDRQAPGANRQQRRAGGFFGPARHSESPRLDRAAHLGGHARALVVARVFLHVPVTDRLEDASSHRARSVLTRIEDHLGRQVPRPRRQLRRAGLGSDRRESDLEVVPRPAQEADARPHQDTDQRHDDEHLEEREARVARRAV